MCRPGKLIEELDLAAPEPSTGRTLRARTWQGTRCGSPAFIIVQLL